MTKLRVPLVILLLGLLVSCGQTSVPNPPSAPVTQAQANLTNAANTLLIVARSVGALQTSVISLNTNGSLSTPTTKSILLILQKVNTFTGQASNIIRGQVSLPASQQSSLLSLLTPITQTLSTDISSSVVNITDANVKSTVQLALLGIQTLLSSLQISLQ